MTPLVLIVDDDPNIREILRIALERQGFRTEEAPDGAAALTAAAKLAPDLIVLDIGLPELDGLEVCRQLRRTAETPVLFLSARDEEIDRIVGLELGADDYVTKPFSPRELVARVKAIIKRAGASPASDPARLIRGALSLLPETRQCSFAGQPVILTASEFRLLERLMQRPDHIASRIQLTDTLYGGNSNANDRTTESHLRNLRRKLAEAGCPDAIETLHGIGVRMGPCQGA